MELRAEKLVNGFSEALNVPRTRQFLGQFPYSSPKGMSVESLSLSSQWREHLISIAFVIEHV